MSSPLLNAWDVCFAHTTAQVDSDLTEWGRFSPDAVMQRGPGSFTVRISNVRDGARGLVQRSPALWKAESVE